ncbi:hypothetical protein ACIBQ1_60340 [Nonomuraea sp. NPDC050153]|uniref:hypothetical protein n=1 Tax=Nonomuraea sp. NPDC050153 TaxID=3364359 RepID=UPI0037A32EC9
MLVNHDAIQEGLLLLEQASRLDNELLLALPSMHTGDRFYGAIVRDISRRVAAGYPGFNRSRCCLGHESRA